MERKTAAACAVFCASSLLLIAAAPSEKVSEKVRKFDFTYEVTIKGLSSETRLVRVWIPLASSDQNQRVVVKKISSPGPMRTTREPEYGNRMLFAEIHHPKSPTAKFTVEYSVRRREYSKGDYERLRRYNHEPVIVPVVARRFLEPDRLVPIDGKMKQLAEENTSGESGAIEKARALYDYIFGTFRYDKSGTGWGRGDAVWACDAQRGNCTDFHSFFISMMRAEKIPARFEIGFPLPVNAHEGEIPGYHCWAEFFVDGAGWVPVDISEAWKDKSKHDYFFGTLDVNRVQFSIGRDITLVPKQSGEPINYFIYPYVEVDGKPYEKMDKKFAYREIGTSREAATSAGR